MVRIASSKQILEKKPTVFARDEPRDESPFDKAMQHAFKPDKSNVLFYANPEDD